MTSPLFKTVVPGVKVRCVSTAGFYQPAIEQGRAPKVGGVYTVDRVEPGGGKIGLTDSKAVGWWNTSNFESDHVTRKGLANVLFHAHPATARSEEPNLNVWGPVADAAAAYFGAEYDPPETVTVTVRTELIEALRAASGSTLGLTPMWVQEWLCDIDNQPGKA